jgi:acetylornithine deacetylase/succinyl-diaminopimelate desuccinylase-like protein
MTPPTPSARAQRASAYAHANRNRFVRFLQDFARFPSVSGQSRHAADVRRCAEWLARDLHRLGLRGVAVHPTRRYPIVYAEWLGARGRPTVLVYGHYDVQPVDPESAWRTPPFAASIRKGALHGRGVCDDKGQLSTHLRAIESYLATARRLPVNVKCIFEGEEEIGSPNVRAFLERRRRALRADVAVMSDTRMLGPDRPAIAYGLRGSLSLEVEVLGPGVDLHSGNFGGAIHNPLQALSELLAELHDRDGRITIPGFYRRVLVLAADERARLRASGPSDAEILRDAQARAGWGERGYSLYERTTIRPAITINGITGGYQGPGGKAVIPARASVKLNVRLVPDQTPDEVARLIRSHVADRTPRTVRTRVRVLSGAMPVVLERRHPAMAAAANAYRRGFGVPPVFVRSGGTIPIVNSFREVLGLHTVLLGFALPDDRIHAPNERFRLDSFFRGTQTAIAFLDEVAARGLGSSELTRMRRRPGEGRSSAPRARAGAHAAPRRCRRPTSRRA